MAIDLKTLNQFIQVHEGIHTYIGLDEEGDDLHVACLALECMGFIKKSISEEHHVFWLPTRVNKQARDE